MVAILTSCITLLLLLGTAIAEEYPPGPVPYCSSRPIMPLLPLTINETITVDMSNFFSGYNLDISLQASNFSYICPKYNTQSSNHTNLSLPVSMHLTHKGNQQGQQFSLLVNNSQHTTYLHYGIMKTRNEIPRIQNTVMVENRNDTDCFDAVIISSIQTIVVDCVVRSGALLQNVYILVDMPSGNVTSNQTSHSFEQFRWVTKRRMLEYHNPKNGYNYIVRAHLAEGVDPGHQNNTYIELIKIEEKDIVVVGVIDRSFMGMPTLRIMDVNIYNQELFFLDYNSGLHRINITTSEVIKLRASYPCQYFLKFGVYSDNMDDQLLVAVANEHSIYQINWDTESDPQFVTKYSLLQNSSIKQVAINREFVIVQSSVEATIIGEFSALLNYTWVFSRGSRTYSNAYLVFSHTNEQVLLDFDREGNYLMLINAKGIDNYEIARPILTIKQTNDSMLDQQAKLIVVAVSKDFANPNIVYCTEQIQIVFVQPDNMSLWPAIKEPYEIMYINYPGQLNIDLDRYAIGPNISYIYLALNLHEGSDWVLKQNRTNLTFHSTAGNINFLHTDVIEQYGNNTILLYCQDQQNNTYVSLCINEWETININCSVLSHYQHKSRLNSLATAFVEGSFQQQNYIYIMNLQGTRNIISMFWFDTSQRFGTITYPEGFEGEVGDLAVSNGILFVTLPSMKRIDAYYLKFCEATECPLGFSITASTLRPLGVEYFAPRRIRTTRVHPEVIFIECLDSIIILDVDNKDNILLLKELNSTATAQRNFQIAINAEYLVIVALPDIIEEYKMTDLYKGKIVFHKQLPLYRYRMSSPFDLQFNDQGNMFYLTAIDPQIGCSVVLVYRLGTTLVNSFYDVISFKGTQQTSIELEVSGGYVDFVTVVQKGHFTITKQYERPSMVIENEDHQLQFLIEAKNTADIQQINKVTVKVANYPDNFNRSRDFPSSTANYFTEKIDKRYTWSDRNWFKGHILNYYYKCQQCPDKIVFESHLLQVSQLPLPGQDYHRSLSGGYVLWEDVFRLHANGTVRSIETLPKPNTARDEICKKIVPDPNNLYVVSACINGYMQVNLYLTSYVSRKGFTMGPWKTGSLHVANLQIVNGIMILVDVGPIPAARIRSGGVFIYAMSLDAVENQKFIELEYIDTNDLVAAHGWISTQDIFVGNAHLIFSDKIQIYRLFVTEVKNGLFIASFIWRKGLTELTLKSVDYLDLNKILADNGFHLPNDATYEAVTHVRTSYSQHFQIDSVVVITRNYHNFEFNVIYQENGRLQNCFLNKVYYRYGYYRTYNMAKAFNGFLAIPYTLPPIQEYMSNFSRQVVSLYDTVDYADDIIENGYRERYFIAGHVLDTVTETSFDFNQTYGQGNETIGLVIIDPKNQLISQNKISKNLSIIVKDQLYKTQNLYLWPYSDFHKLMFQLQIVGEPDLSLTGWQIFLIVLGSIIVAIGLFFGGRWVLKKWRLSRKKTYLLEEDQGEDEEEEQYADGVVNASVRESAQTNTLEEPLLRQEEKLEIRPMESTQNDEQFEKPVQVSTAILGAQPEAVIPLHQDSASGQPTAQATQNVHSPTTESQPQVSEVTQLHQPPSDQPSKIQTYQQPTE